MSAEQAAGAIAANGSASADRASCINAFPHNGGGRAGDISLSLTPTQQEYAELQEAVAESLRSARREAAGKGAKLEVEVIDLVGSEPGDKQQGGAPRAEVDVVDLLDSSDCEEEGGGGYKGASGAYEVVVILDESQEEGGGEPLGRGEGAGRAEASSACLVCLERFDCKEGGAVALRGCPSHHTVCRGCLKKYVEAELVDGKTSVECLVPGCATKVSRPHPDVAPRFSLLFCHPSPRLPPS